MNTIHFSNRSDVSVTEVLSPFSGQLPLARRHPVAGALNTIALFPGSGPQRMKVPQFGYSLETLAFSVCGAAGIGLLLIAILGVS